MIPHILRKDLKLLWKPALAVSALYPIATVFFSWRFVQLISEAASIAVCLVAFYLLVTVVHQDPIPSDRADWLTRPIPRFELLSAKLLFALVTVVGPMMLVDFGVALALGFDLGPVLQATLSHGVTVFLGLVLPVMAIAALTRNLPQSLIGVAIIALAYSVFLPLLPWSAKSGDRLLGWIVDATILGIGLVAASIVLWLQYKRRMTRTSVFVALASCVCVVMSGRAPWRNSWPVQARLTPTTTEELQIRFAATKGPFHIPGHVRSANTLYLPLILEGWRPERQFIKHVRLRLRFAGGQVIESVAAPGGHPTDATYFPFAIGATHPTGEAEAEVTMLFVDEANLDRQSIPMDGQFRHIPNVGRCRSIADRYGPWVECVQIGDQGIGVEISQESSRATLSLTENPLSPFFLRFAPSAFTRAATHLNRYGPNAGPVHDPSQRVDFQPFRIRGVIERKVRIPNLRLSDWTLH